MSDQVPLVEPTGEPAPLEVEFSENQANYLIHILAFYRPVMEDFLTKVPLTEAVACLAFLQAALDVQMENAYDAFNDTRRFFQTVYPPLLENHIQAHPDLAEKPFLLVVPSPTPGKVAQNPFQEESKIISTGSDWKQ